MQLTQPKVPWNELSSSVEKIKKELETYHAVVMSYSFSEEDGGLTEISIHLAYKETIINSFLRSAVVGLIREVSPSAVVTMNFNLANESISYNSKTNVIEQKRHYDNRPF